MTQNQLSLETSPYLLQHKDNPVHWHAWNEKTLELAKTLDRPVLLSIGYSSCHWCHVMAHESFEDQQTANLMNQYFLNIKVDREEFPDVDKIYMSALHCLGIQGGWPLTMFLTPDAKPFWGGTYFPPKPAFNRPGFKQVLFSIAQLWKNRRHEIVENSDGLQQIMLNIQDTSGDSSFQLNMSFLQLAARQIIENTDFLYGGLKGAPKFPQTLIYDFLWKMYLKTKTDKYSHAVITTLTNICQGGIYDHLAGGFARYSTDERWLVPHFEKMLYDNALLLKLLNEVSKISSNKLFRQRIEETVHWLFSEMINKNDTFSSSIDADSEGREGKFYVWSKSEIIAILPDNSAKDFCHYYNVTTKGNWEGTNILNRLTSKNPDDKETKSRIDQARKLLLNERNKRIKPATDDKSLVDWNALTVCALIEIAMVQDRHEYYLVAEKCYNQITALHFKDKILYHSYRDGLVRNPASADDYANFINAAITMFEASQQPQYLDDAKSLFTSMLDLFYDEQSGGFYYTSQLSGELIIRTRSASDDVTPNANATMLDNLNRLYFLTGHEKYRSIANKIIHCFSDQLQQNAISHSGFLSGFLQWSNQSCAIIVNPANDKTGRSLISQLFKLPMRPVILMVDANDKFSVDHPANNKPCINNKTTLYICTDNSCSAPVTDFSDIGSLFADNSDIH